MSIEPYYVAISEVLAVLSLATVRAMPWRLRLTLAIPHVFIAFIYFYPMANADRMPLLRGALIAAGLSITAVSLLSTWQRRRVCNFRPKV